MSDLICALHPEHIDEYFSVTENGHITHCRYGKNKLVRDYGKVPAMLTYHKKKRNYDYQTKKVNMIEDEHEPYKDGYIGEIIWPWFSVFQEYGTNGCVCNLETGEIKMFSRESYYCENTNFSAALFIYRQHVCLLHQTFYNQLDVTDLESGELLTYREEMYQQPPQKDENGNSIMERKDGVDYFHGRITFSPDYKYFVDTGWVWQPDGVPYVYRVEDFLERYEFARISLYVQDSFLFGEDWDQYAVWLDDSTFAFDFIPDEEVIEEIDTTGLPENHKSVFLTFSMENVEDDESSSCVKTRIVEKLPLSPMCISSMTEGRGCRSKDYCPTLYYDRKEHLLISIDGSHVAMYQKTTGRKYTFVFSDIKGLGGKCFYSKEHHAIFRESFWYEANACATLEDILAKLEE